MKILPETWILPNGRPVRWRALQPDDAPRLAALIDGLSPVERQARVRGGVYSLAATEWQRLCAADRADTLAGVVCVSGTDGDAIVAEARCGLDAAHGRAELALLVAPAWRRLGLASRCLRMLHAALLRHGVPHWRARVPADNRPMQALLERFEFTRQWHGADAGCVLYARALRAPGRCAAEALAGADHLSHAGLRGTGWAS